MIPNNYLWHQFYPHKKIEVKCVITSNSNEIKPSCRVENQKRTGAAFFVLFERNTELRNIPAHNHQ
jgi:hypothetical protein